MAIETVTIPTAEAVLASVPNDRRTTLGILLPHFQNDAKIDLERIAASFILINGFLASSVTAAEVETQLSARFAAFIGSAPAALDTVHELAAAFNDNPDVIDQILAALGLRATKAELEAAVSTLNTELGGKASTAALGAVADRVTAIETAFPSRARLIARAIAYSESADMAKTFEAPFAQTKKTSVAVASAAKTTYNDAVNAVRLHKAGVDGGILRRITAIARATVSATQLQFYRSQDGGVTLTLWRTKAMPANNMNQTTEMPITDLGLDFDQNVGLAPNEEIWFGIGVALAAGIVATAEAEDF